MNKEISSRLRWTFLIHLIVAGVLGIALFAIPGRTLMMFGWVEEMVMLPESELSVPGGTFVDPLITRLLGAAMLALAFSSYLGWRAKEWGQVSILVQMETVYCVLGTLVFIITIFLTERAIPPAIWALLVVLIAFAVAWGIAWLRGE